MPTCKAFTILWKCKLGETHLPNLNNPCILEEFVPLGRTYNARPDFAEPKYVFQIRIQVQSSSWLHDPARIPNQNSALLITSNCDIVINYFSVFCILPHLLQASLLEVKSNESSLYDARLGSIPDFCWILQLTINRAVPSMD